MITGYLGKTIESLLVTRKKLLYWWNRGCCMTFLGIFPCEVKHYFLRGEIEPMWVEIEKLEILGKILNFFLGGGGHLVTIFDQFTFFMHSTVWTISKHSSGTIIDQICKHSLSFIAKHNQWTPFVCNTNQTIS